MAKRALFMSKDLDNKINKLLDIVAEIVVGAAGKQKVSGFELWPFHPIQGRLFFTKDWFAYLFKYLKQIDEENLSDKRIAYSFKAPSKIAQLLWMLDGIKQTELTIEERLYVVQRLFDLLGVWRKDIFCKDGKNLTLSLKEVKQLVKRAKFVELKNNPSFKKDVCVLESALWMYAEMIYFSNHPFAHSFQGPYKLGSKILVKRNYFDLRPEFWPFSKKLKFGEVEILEIYKKEADIKFDFFERGIRTQKPYRDKLLEVSIRVGKRALSSEKGVEGVLANLNVVIENGSRRIQKLSRQDLIAKYASYWFYALKPLYQLVKEPWQLPQEVEDNIYKRFDKINAIWRGIEKKRLSAGKLTLKERAESFKRLFDPRIEGGE
jgi:hypothetical protein